MDNAVPLAISQTCARESLIPPKMKLESELKVTDSIDGVKPVSVLIICPLAMSQIERPSPVITANAFPSGLKATLFISAPVVARVCTS